MRRGGIDHIVLCVGDLAAARAAFGRIGFTTTPPARHPFGTGNSLVQLQGNFIELLTVVDADRIAPASDGEFSFGAFNRDFLARRQGFSMLALESGDARRDQAAFAAAGLVTYPVFDFARPARLPDGATVTVGFSLAFVTDPRLPDMVFFACQQHAPQHFWKPDYQRHANGARVVGEAVMVADDPANLADLFAGLLGRDAVRMNNDRLVAATARGEVTVLTPAAFGERFGVDASGTPSFAAFAVLVEDIDAAEATAAANGVAYRRRGGRLLITDAAGTVLELRAAPAARRRRR